MIVIQSDRNDSSTNDVLDWIFFLSDEKTVRFNNTTSIDKITYKISNREKENISVRIDNETYDNEKINSFWYRRGKFDHIDLKFTKNSDYLNILQSKIQINNFKEQNHLDFQLYKILTSLKGEKINDFQDNLTNKIANLSKAVESGLSIPDTIITNDINEIEAFLNLHKKLISKDIKFSPIKIPYNDTHQISIRSSVKIISQNDISELSKKNNGDSRHHFSLYQQYIEKKYELRIFYLKGKFYTMAIFSQANEKTKIDFRNYDNERPNRCVPFKLPQEIEEKLHHFMQSIDMNCGSIDVICTPQREYVFLEVNPVGQFQWLSKNCNYDIERQIALDLLKEKT